MQSELARPHVTLARMLPSVPLVKSRVLIADDHAVWRGGLRHYLEPHFEIIGEASEGLEAVRLAEATEPNIVVMDINMPGMNGIAAALRIKQSLPKTQIIILSATDSDEQVYESIQAGINAYVVKDDTPETIWEAVLNVAQGKGYLSPRIAGRVLRDVGLWLNGGGQPPLKRGVTLTSREHAVLLLMADGRSNKQIARELRISERTLGNDIATLYSKLGVDSRAPAIVHAIKEGLVAI